MPDRVSVIVPAWDFARRDQLGRCVGAIAAQSRAADEVIVVIDHNPELLAWAQRALPEATVIANGNERGVVGARNSGLAAASGEIVVFTDDDTEAEPDWIAVLLACFEDPRVVGVAGQLVPRWTGAEPRWFPPEFYWVFGCSYAGLPDHPAPVRNPIAANMAVRREAIEAVGGFRPGVKPHRIAHRGVVIAGGHALEDTALGIAIGRRLPGRQWLYQPAAVVHHAVDPEQATLGYLVRRSFEEGLGKAMLARSIGSEEGLSSERRHLLGAIPGGLARDLRALLGGDAAGLGRSVAILAGVLAAGAGFLVGSVQARLGGTAEE
jgi:hypothetical protein